MHALLTATLLGSCLVAQQVPGGSPAAAPSEQSPKRSLNPVKYDGFGWPTVGAGDVQAAPAPAGETKAAVSSGAVQRRDGGATVEAAKHSAELSAGMANQALLDIYRKVGTPGQQQTLGGCDATWRLTVHGEDGSVLGERIYHHVSDSATPARDRLVYGDRVFVRDGDAVQAGSGGVRYESLQTLAARELELFGMHLRAPWSFADSEQFRVVQQDMVARRGVRLGRLVFERASAGEAKPARSSANTEQFVLLYDPLAHLPRELEHRFAGTQQRRRVLLEDWQELMPGVRFPCRRVYVDELLRPTTTIELMDLRKRPVRAREFKLL